MYCRSSPHYLVGLGWILGVAFNLRQRRRIEIGNQLFPIPNRPRSWAPKPPFEIHKPKWARCPGLAVFPLYFQRSRSLYCSALGHVNLDALQFSESLARFEGLLEDGLLPSRQSPHR
jgi:hypothetical protein